jgi:hypothetical protein
MDEGIKFFVGLDVHKDTIAAICDRAVQLRPRRTLLLYPREHALHEHALHRSQMPRATARRRPRRASRA